MIVAILMRSALLAAGLVTLAAASGERLVPIALQPGFTAVDHLAPDGRNGLVAQAWRENGNAHGYTVTMVMLRNHDGSTVVVPIERGPASSTDVISDDPHTGDDALRSVQLARGSIGQASGTFLLVATRKLAKPEDIAEATPVDIEVFRLVHDEGVVGGSPDVFRLTQTEHLTDRYCSATTALRRRLHLDKTAAPPPATC